MFKYSLRHKDTVSFHLQIKGICLSIKVSCFNTEIKKSERLKDHTTSTAPHLRSSHFQNIQKMFTFFTIKIVEEKINTRKTSFSRDQMGSNSNSNSQLAKMKNWDEVLGQT